MNSQMNGKRQRSAADHCLSPGIKTPWSIASLRPAPPLYTLKTFGKITYISNNFFFRRIYIIASVQEKYLFDQ